MLPGFDAYSFSANTSEGHTITHDVYRKGTSDAVVVIVQELPGIGPETLSLAERLHDEGFSVVLPHLFGPLGKTALGGNLIRVFCLRKEFKLFERNQSSPIVDWLKALCQDLRDTHDVRAIGVIGMCLTGNFAISLMADDSVLAGVASQPSMPLNKQRALHMSADDIQAVRAGLDSKGPMMALRFAEDILCTRVKFDALKRTFNDDAERIKLIELKGKGHSVLTLDLYRRGTEAQDKLNDVIAYFKDRLLL